MPLDLVQSTNIASAALSGIAAVFSAIAAWGSFKLARGLHDEAKSDERIILGRPSHPTLGTRAHAEKVIQVPIFNKSKRKAYVDEVTVYDRQNRRIEVTWADAIDELGMPQRPADLVGVIDTATLFIRANVLEDFDYARVLLTHSFSQTKEMVIFDPSADFVVAEEGRVSGRPLG